MLFLVGQCPAEYNSSQLHHFFLISWVQVCLIRVEGAWRCLHTPKARHALCNFRSILSHFLNCMTFFFFFFLSQAVFFTSIVWAHKSWVWLYSSCDLLVQLQLVFNKNLAEIAILYRMPGLSLYLNNDTVIDYFYEIICINVTIRYLNVKYILI